VTWKLAKAAKDSWALWLENLEIFADGFFLSNDKGNH